MRFLNENYLRAFPRDEKSAQQIQQSAKHIVKDEPGDVLATDEDPVTEPDPTPEPEEVKEDGTESRISGD